MEWSRPKREVSEGLWALAEDMRPEATLLIGLSHYALQSYKSVIIYITGVSVSVSNGSG